MLTSQAVEITRSPRQVGGEQAPEHERRSVLGDLREVIADFRSYRELIYQLTLRDIRIRYKQAVMGLGWAILMPALIVLAGLCVRYAMANVGGTSLDTGEVLGMVVKALGWAFFVGAISFSTVTLIANITLVTKVYFPREVLPLSSTLAQTFDSAIGVSVLVVLLAVMDVQLTAAIFWAPVLALLLFLFTLALALILSCANLFFRDVKYIVQVLLTFGIFFTPVLFEPAMFGPNGARLLMLNPLSPLLEGLRLSLVAGHDLLQPLIVASAKGEAILAWSPWYLAYSAAWSVGALLGGMVLFHRLEFVFAEYV